MWVSVKVFLNGYYYLLHYVMKKNTFFGNVCTFLCSEINCIIFPISISSYEKQSGEARAPIKIYYNYLAIQNFKY